MDNQNQGNQMPGQTPNVGEPQQPTPPPAEPVPPQGGIQEPQPIPPPPPAEEPGVGGGMPGTPAA